jgi:hypothetical protein
LFLETGQATIALLRCLHNSIIFAIASIWFFAFGCFRLDSRDRNVSWVDASSSCPLNILSLFNELRTLALWHDAILGRSAWSFALLNDMTDKIPWQIVLKSHLLRNEPIDISGFEFAFVWLA